MLKDTDRQPSFDLEDQQGAMQAPDRMTSNPVTNSNALSATTVDIASGLKDGSISAEEAVPLLESQLRAETVAMVEDLRAEIGSGGVVVQSTFQKMLERVTGGGAPCFHQALVFFAASAKGSKDAEHRWKALCGSTLMVLGQCMVVVGVAMGSEKPSCSTNDQCQDGMYCTITGRQRCDYCGYVPLPNTLQTFDPTTGITGPNATVIEDECAVPTDHIKAGEHGEGILLSASQIGSWCDSCKRDGTYDKMTDESLISDNVAAMAPFDWAAVFFTTVVVSFTVVAELKDVTIVNLAIRHADDKLNLGWRMVLASLAGLRRRLFLPALVGVIPTLIVLKGGDALSVR